MPVSHPVGAAAVLQSESATKDPRKPPKFLQALKTCFGHGSAEADVSSRNDRRRAQGPEGNRGVQAEYLDEDNMAWGKPKKV